MCCVVCVCWERYVDDMFDSWREGERETSKRIATILMYQKGEKKSTGGQTE